VLCMAVVLFLVVPSDAASCQAKESCDVGQDCGICAEAKSPEICAQVAFCVWHEDSSCSTLPSCSRFQEASCEPKEPSSNAMSLCKTGSGGQELCKDIVVCKPKTDLQIDDSVGRLCESSQSAEACEGMEFCEKIGACEWFDDCRQCSNFTTHIECGSRAFCKWDQGTLPAYPITATDIGFVVAALVCELWTTRRLISWYQNNGLWDCFSLLCFMADVGFTVGKLFPTTYLCRSLDCAKITHNCVMTLASFVFSAGECYMLHAMAKDSSGGKGSTGMVKLLELALCLAYIVYETATTEPPGGGTTALIVVACLAEVLLLCFEGYTVCKYEAKVLPE